MRYHSTDSSKILTSGKNYTQFNWRTYPYIMLFRLTPKFASDFRDWTESFQVRNLQSDTGKDQPVSRGFFLALILRTICTAVVFSDHPVCFGVGFTLNIEGRKLAYFSLLGVLEVFDDWSLQILIGTNFPKSSWSFFKLQKTVDMQKTSVCLEMMMMMMMILLLIIINNNRKKVSFLFKQRCL